MAWEGPIKFENSGPRLIEERARSLSPESNANYGAGTDQETLQAQVDTENPSQLITYYNATQDTHYGMSGISTQAAVMAAMGAAAGTRYSYSLTSDSSLEKHVPRIESVDRKRAGSLRSPRQMNTQLKFQQSTSAEYPSSPKSLCGAVEESPLLVNPKQFHRILKRRVARQRLEEALRIKSKGRKTYLHKSRLNHANRRSRGLGGKLLTADEAAEIERLKGENEKENEKTPATKVYGRSDSPPFRPEIQSLNNQQPASSTSHLESVMIDSELQIQRKSCPGTKSVDQRQVAICNSFAREIGEALFDASQIDARGNFTRSRSLSQTRSTGSNESTVAFMATPRSRSADTEEGTSMIRSRTRSNLRTDEEDSWSSEFEEDATPKPPTLTGDQRNCVEQVMETFWDVMNKNWKYCFYKKTKNLGEAGTSSTAPHENTSQTTSGTSTLPIPSQKSLGKRPANDDDRDSEERQPKRDRDESNLPADASGKIKYSCPYRKHDRRRYNVHTHRTCALTGFSDIARVKEHLYRNHRAPIQCHRCTLQFDDQRALKTHIKAKTMCELIEGASVEGFELDVEEQLRRRKKSSREQSVESRWADIYLLLFPNDDPDSQPSPFWEPPTDEPAPTSIPIEDYIRQEVPRRVRQLIEDRLATGDYSYDLILILSNQMMDIFEAQIDTCILEHRSTVGKGSQKSEPLTPPPFSSISSAVSMEQPAAVSFPLSISAPRLTSPVVEDWFATYLHSEIPPDSLHSFPPLFNHIPLEQLSGTDNMPEDLSTEQYHIQSSQKIDGQA